MADIPLPDEEILKSLTGEPTEPAIAGEQAGTPEAMRPTPATPAVNKEMLADLYLAGIYLLCQEALKVLDDPDQIEAVTKALKAVSKVVDEEKIRALQTQVAVAGGMPAGAPTGMPTEMPLI